MKHFILALSLFCSLALGNGAWAQNNAKVHFTAGSFSPEKNQWLNDGNHTSSLVNNRYCGLLAWDHQPSAAEKALLIQSGVELVQYLPDYAFLVTVPGNVSPIALKQAGATAFSEIPAWAKLDKRLKGPVYPTWATQGDFVKVELTYFPGTSGDVLANNLGIKALEKVNTIFHRLTILVLKTQLTELIQMPWVQYIEPIHPDLQFVNLPGRTMHRASVLGNPLGRNLDGTGVIYGEWDGGGAYAHLDFGNRMTRLEGIVPGLNSDHATHVCGTVLGAGIIDPYATGMSPNASLFSWDFNGDLPTEVADGIVNQSIVLTQNSWGYGTEPCGDFGTYDAYSSAYDQNAHNNAYLLQVFAAGNEQSACTNGWQTVSSGANTAKNILTVGAVDYKGQVSGFSSFGPVLDGRLKPEVCGVGVNVYSTQKDNTYAGGWSGTSMATPGVSGTIGQLYQLYRNINGGNTPDAALIKAIVMNSAIDRGNDGPDYKYGYGLFNGLKAAEDIENTRYYSGSLNTSDADVHTLTVSSSTELKVMLCYSDPEAVANASTALVNDLDLYLINPNGDTVRPWILDPVNPGNTAVTGIDRLNNQEQVTLQAPADGSYEIHVEGYNVPSGPQTFYVTYEVKQADLTVVYPMGGESFNPGSTETIRWDGSGMGTYVDIDYSEDNGATWNSIATSVFALNFVYDWTVPNTFTGQALIRITDGTLTSISPFNFSIAGTPSLSGTPGNTTADLSWGAINGATDYNVYQLVNNAWSLLGTSSNQTTYTVTGLTNGTAYWFTVQAIGNNNMVSNRAYAVEVTPSTNMVFDSANAYQWNTQEVGKGSFNQDIMVVNIHTTGAATPLSASSFTFSTNGTTNASDITNASLYYTGNSSVFSTNGLVSSFSQPSGSFSMNGSITLSEGDNYFWLAYDVDANATVKNVLDAEGSQVVVGGTTYNVTNQAPSGNRVIGYCKPTGGYDDDLYNGQYGYTFGIAGVEMAGVSNFTGIPQSSADYYQNYSNLTGKAVAGASFDVTIYPGDVNYGQSTIIWVDWNRDYTFDVNTEAVAASYYMNATTTLSFTVPFGTPVGNYRMRMISGYWYYYYFGYSAFDPCDNPNPYYFDISECEDYTLEVRENISLSNTGPFCPDATPSFVANANSNYQYDWYLDGSVVYSGVGATYSQYDVTSASFGNHSVWAVITDQTTGESTSSDALTFWMNAQPGSSISANGNTTFCQGGSVTLSADVSLANPRSNTITILYDATKGQSGLSGASKVYLHSGITLNQNQGTSWNNVVGNWGMDDGVGEMTSLGNDQWTITIDAYPYYAQDPTQAIDYLSLVFRNADGSQTGKGDNGDDIFLDLTTGTIASTFSGVSASFDQTYQWTQFGAPLPGANQSTYTTSNAGDYTCMVTGSSCMLESNTIKVTVDPTVVAGTASATTTTLCEGSSTDLKLQGNTGTIDWQWFDATNNVWVSTGLTSNTVTINPTKTTKYAAVVTSGTCGSATSNEVTITVDPTSVAGTAAASQTAICNGTQVDLTLSGYTGTIDWQWFDATNNVWTSTGATSSTYQVTPSASVDYRAVVTSGTCSSANSNTISIQVTPLAVGGTASASANTICNGSTTSIQLSGETGTIDWEYFDATNNAWVSLGTSTNPLSVSPTSNTDYRAAVTSGSCGTDYSNVVSIAVDPLAVAGTATASQNAICSGTQIDLTLSGSVGTIDWQWFDATNNTWVSTGITTSTYQLTPTASGDYRAVVTSGVCGSDISNTVSIQVTPIPVGGTISASQTAICSGATTDITATGTTGTIDWEYYDVANNTWVSLGQNSNPLSLTLSVGTDIRAAVTSGNCGTDYSNTISIVVNPNPIAATATASSTTICSGTSISLDATGNTGSTDWEYFDVTTNTWTSLGLTSASINVAPTSSTDYRVSTTLGSCGPVYSNVVSIQVSDPPVSGTVSASNSSICIGSSTDLTVSGSQGNVSWEVYDNGVWTSLNNNTTTITVSPTTATDYRVVVSSGVCTSVTSNVITIQVNPLPVAGTATGPSSAACQGASQQLVLTGYTGNITWEYYDTGMSMWMDAGSNSDTYSVAPSTSTEYRARVENACGTQYSNMVLLVVTPSPTATIAASGATTFCAGDSVTLNVTTESGNTIQWLLNGVVIANQSGSSIVVKTSGDYTAQVSNPTGCVTTSSTINVSLIALPSAPTITQNGNTLTSSVTPGGGITLQWYLNGLAISGADQQSYNPVQRGTYKVVVTNSNGCTAESGDWIFSFMGIENSLSQLDLKLFPNPTSDIVNLDISGLTGEEVLVIQLTDVTGKVLETNTPVKGHGMVRQSFNLGEYASGMYFIHVGSSTSKQTLRVIKAN